MARRREQFIHTSERSHTVGRLALKLTTVGTGVAAAPTTVGGRQPLGLQLADDALQLQPSWAPHAAGVFTQLHGSGGLGQSHGGVSGCGPVQAVQFMQLRQVPQPEHE